MLEVVPVGGDAEGVAEGLAGTRQSDRRMLSASRSASSMRGKD